MKIVIEKGVPIPPKQTGRKKGEAHGWKYPFKSMEVGDSFLVPNISNSGMVSLCSRYREAGLGHFVTRSEPRGVRVWRVA